MGDENKQGQGAGEGGAGGGAPPPAGGGTGGQPPPAGGGAPPAGGNGAGGQPFATFHTQAAFDERIDRAARAKMRELGLDPEQAKKDREELDRLKKEAEEREAAEMTELDKAKKAAEKAAAEKLEAENAAKRAREEAEIAKLAAKHRVPDLEYLGFRLSKLDATVDRDEWLTKQLEDSAERVRFGVEKPGEKPGDGGEGGAGGGEKPKATTTTTPKGGKPDPQAGGGKGGQGGDQPRAMQMTKSEFEQYKRTKYGAGGRGIRKGYKPPPG